MSVTCCTKSYFFSLGPGSDFDQQFESKNNLWVMALHEFRNIVKHSDRHRFFHAFVPGKK